MFKLLGVSWEKGKQHREEHQEEDFWWAVPAALACLSCSAIPQSSAEFGELHYEAEIREWKD